MPSHEAVDESGLCKYFANIAGHVASLSETIAESRGRGFEVSDELVNIVLLPGPVDPALIKRGIKALTKLGRSRLDAPQQLIDFLLLADTIWALLRRNT